MSLHYKEWTQLFVSPEAQILFSIFGDGPDCELLFMVLCTHFVQPNVHTICMVSAASMGSFIMARREITKRVVFPYAWCQ
ncbi:putative endopeptidase Clp [Helianthus anomalus]